MGARLIALLSAAALLGAGFTQDKKPEQPVLAVIIHPKNPTTKLTLGQLRDYFLIERERWTRKLPTELHLPKPGSTARKILLSKVYRMSEKDLRKHWVRKIFRGSITDFPSVAPSAKVAIELVRDDVGAFSAILASEVTEDVQVLAIDGKLPGDEGYPLVGKVESTEPLTGVSGHARVF